MDNELIEMPIEVQLIDNSKAEYPLAGYTPVPVAEVSSCGLAGNEIYQLVSSIKATSGGEGLYRVTFPEGFNGTLTKFANENYYMGSLREGGQFAGQARMTPVGFDPAQLFIGLVLMDINSKLGDILENQIKMQEYNYEKEESIVRGNFNMLNEAISNYKYNYDRDRFISQNISLVSNIKADTYKSMDLSKRQINNILATPNNPHMLRTAGKTIKELTRFVGQYHDEVMLLSYSSFFEVLLHKNFSKDNLENISSTLNTQANEYSFLHQQCYEWGRSYIESSVNYKAGPLLSLADKAWETGLKKVPYDFDKKYAADSELYQSSSQQLEHMNAISESGTAVYISEIKRLNSFHNDRLSVIVDSDSVYLPDEIVK